MPKAGSVRISGTWPALHLVGEGKEVEEMGVAALHVYMYIYNISPSGAAWDAEAIVGKVLSNPSDPITGDALLSHDVDVGYRL